MDCNSSEKKCCGACFVGKASVVDLFGKIVTAAHTTEGRLVVSAGGVNFSVPVNNVMGDPSSLVGKVVTQAYMDGTTAPLPDTWTYVAINCGINQIRASR